MNVAIFVLEVLALVAMVVVHRHNLKGLGSFFEDRLKAQDEAEEARRLALYKQQKASERTVARSDAAVRKIADRTRGLQDEVARAVRRVDRLADDMKREG